ncbi:hypothetical protein HHI36_012183 [Cryptolaemus montrouzieri]|uniref:Uncharacterized protein n=1 Tax=Cryptolaemus montrouzieri TaxID=559131 RepID=A0ABD2NER5_9CUCU
MTYTDFTLYLKIICPFLIPTSICPRMKPFHPPDLTLLKYDNILSIENPKIMEIGPQQTKYYFVPSMAMLHTTCAVSNTRKEIFPTATIDEEKYIILPKMTIFPRKSKDMKCWTNENIPDITVEEVDQWNLQLSRFTLILILSILVFMIFTYFIFKYLRKKYFYKFTPNEGDTFNLRGEKLHDTNTIF